LADLAGNKTEKKEGHMLYELSSRLIKFPSVDPFAKFFVDQIVAKHWLKTMQLEEAILYVTGELKKNGDTWALDVPAFEVATGVGINITEADIQRWVDEQFKANEAEIAE
jgi:hypothetical protein|tara:strand:- start:613 stop:942 length:330 start_codon:yes stop_codon:yes gene_type:complete